MSSLGAHVILLVLLCGGSNRYEQTVPTQKEQSDQGLHFLLHILDAILYGKTILFRF